MTHPPQAIITAYHEALRQLSPQQQPWGIEKIVAFVALEKAYHALPAQDRARAIAQSFRGG